MNSRKIIFHVRKEYFEQIKSREKRFEYRKATTYWRKRLKGGPYSVVEIHCGYPKAGDPDRVIRRLWKGYYAIKMTHKEFGQIW